MVMIVDPSSSNNVLKLPGCQIINIITDCSNSVLKQCGDMLVKHMHNETDIILSLRLKNDQKAPKKSDNKSL